MVASNSLRLSPSQRCRGRDDGQVGKQAATDSGGVLSEAETAKAQGSLLMTTPKAVCND